MATSPRQVAAEDDAAASLNILHLSDLHIDPANEEESLPVFWGLCDQLRRLRLAKNVHPNLILVTGDLVHQGAEDYEPTLKRLGEVGKAAGCPPERFFIVPGNHDVTRPKVRNWNAYRQAVIVLKASPQECDRLAGELADAIRRGFNAYHTGFACHWPLLATDEIRLPGFAQADVEIAGVPLRLCGLNTALIAGPEDDGKVDSELRDRVIGRVPLCRMLACSERLPMVLSHYPLSWVGDAERKETEQRLVDARALFFHGHVHREEQNLIGVQQHRQMLTLGAGSIYGAGWNGRNGFSMLRFSSTLQEVVRHEWTWSPTDGWRALEPEQLDSTWWEGWRRRLPFSMARTWTIRIAVSSPDIILEEIDKVIALLRTVVPTADLVSLRHSDGHLEAQIAFFGDTSKKLQGTLQRGELLGLDSNVCCQLLAEPGKGHEKLPPHTPPSDSVLDDPTKVYTLLRCARSSEGTSDEARCESTPPEDLEAVVRQLLQDGQQPVVLGGYGTGKTFFSQKLQSCGLIDVGGRPRQPVLVPLRKWHFAQKDLAPLEAAWSVREPKDVYRTSMDFRADAEAGKILFILDGLDEIPGIHTIQAAQDSVNACLKLANTGKHPNPVLLTSRPGAVCGLKQLGCEPLYLQKWRFPEDFQDYVTACADHLGGLSIQVAELIEAVKGRGELAELATRPLYARLLVQFANKVCRPTGGEINEATLLNDFISRALELGHDRSIIEKVEPRFNCLVSVAALLFASGETSVKTSDLGDVVSRMVRVDTDRVRKFFDMEMSVYSLMIPVSDGRLTFSHESIREYFLAEYMADLLRHNASSELVKILESPRSLSALAARLLCQLFGDHQPLVDFATVTLQRPSHKRANGNCVLLLIAMGHEPAIVKDCAFVSADLSQIDLRRRHFKNCSFIGGTFENTVLNGCHFDGCVLSGVNISGADFRECNFSYPGTRLQQLRPPDGLARFAGALFDKATVPHGRNDDTRQHIQECLERESDGPSSDLARSSLKSLQRVGT